MVSGAGSGGMTETVKNQRQGLWLVSSGAGGGGESRIGDHERDIWDMNF